MVDDDLLNAQLLGPLHGDQLLLPGNVAGGQDHSRVGNRFQNLVQGVHGAAVLGADYAAAFAHGLPFMDGIQGGQPDDLSAQAGTARTAWGFSPPTS